jgi:hypothetical protein
MRGICLHRLSQKEKIQYQRIVSLELKNQIKLELKGKDMNHYNKMRVD